MINHAKLIEEAKRNEVTRPPTGSDRRGFQANWCDVCEKDIDHDCSVLVQEIIERPTGKWRKCTGGMACLDFKERK